MIKFVGNSKVVENLSGIIKTQKINHAYMFSGLAGIGKYILAKEFAKSILCTSPIDGFYCDKCASCTQFENSPDYFYLEPEDALIKVDAVRKFTDNIMLKPIVSNKRVFIIRDAELMNESAQNALLKVIEEPPSYATIILVVSNKEKIINTIKSRCVMVNFSKLSDDEIKEIFGKEIDEEALIYSNGSAGKYINLKNSEFLDSLMIFDKIFNSFDLLEINRLISEIKDTKDIKENITDILDALSIRLGKDLLINSKNKVKKIELIEEVKNNILRNANFDASLDYFGIRVWEINK